MTHPDSSNLPPFPGMASMNDTLEFVKKMWGGMGVPGGQNTTNMPGMGLPGMVIPTMSVDEINKKIADLKTVESWLVLNMNLLRGTIQSLEVQAATLNALNVMGQSMGDAMKAASAMAENVSQPAPAAAKEEAVAPEEKDGPTQASTPDPAANMNIPLASAALWWNALQDQFQQAVTSAMQAEAQSKTETPTAAPSTSEAAKDAASDDVPKPRKKSTTSKSDNKKTPE